jgi:enamine deaminase RidA (YjgF/YER057c/UK114 family)
VEGWPAPSGYANGVVGGARVLHVAGQIGNDPVTGAFADGLAAQFGRALDNVLAVVRAAGGAAEHIAAMTVFVTDMDGYRASRKQIGGEWRARLGTHYPAMALVGVAALYERAALVEIQAVAHLPEGAP